VRAKSCDSSEASKIHQLTKTDPEKPEDFISGDFRDVSLRNGGTIDQEVNDTARPHLQDESHMPVDLHDIARRMLMLSLFLTRSRREVVFPDGLDRGLV
jgi:hypothetical protein